MIVKSTLLAVIMFLGSLSFVEAQVYNNGGVANPGIVLGWNYGYVAFCATGYDGLNTWHYAFFPDGSYAVTNNPGFAAIMVVACQSGNLAGIHVTSLNPFQWNWATAYPFK
jgi:hypothetical protein